MVKQNRLYQFNPVGLCETLGLYSCFLLLSKINKHKGSLLLGMLYRSNSCQKPKKFTTSFIWSSVWFDF